PLHDFGFGDVIGYVQLLGRDVPEREDQQNQAECNRSHFRFMDGNGWIWVHMRGRDWPSAGAGWPTGIKDQKTCSDYEKK
ncbi:MAG: hypothetical protein EA363_11915, partial [Balneolaceae bacterium]